MRVYFFGCWGRPGHELRGPQGAFVPYTEGDAVVRWRRTADGSYKHLDGQLAPRQARDGSVVWAGQADDRKIAYRSAEFPQGVFLHHVLPNGFTALQWWDRCQGDTRGACNSTVLALGDHTTEAMLTILREQFPTVVANLERHGVQLVEVED